jgi:hypothetical protein
MVYLTQKGRCAGRALLSLPFWQGGLPVSSPLGRTVAPFAAVSPAIEPGAFSILLSSSPRSGWTSHDRAIAPPAVTKSSALLRVRALRRRAPVASPICSAHGSSPNRRTAKTTASYRLSADVDSVADSAYVLKSDGAIRGAPFSAGNAIMFAIHSPCPHRTPQPLAAVCCRVSLA